MDMLSALSYIRERLFDIRGGLGYLFPKNYFFSCCVQQVIFSKSKMKQVFLESNTLI